MELTQKQKIIIDGFSNYLSLIKERYGEKVPVLELSDYSVESTEWLDKYILNIIFDFEGENTPKTIEDVVDDIYKFNDFSKLFFPDREPYFSFRMETVK
jgi:hypothetical protein